MVNPLGYLKLYTSFDSLTLITAALIILITVIGYVFIRTKDLDMDKKALPYTTAVSWVLSLLSYIVVLAFSKEVFGQSETIATHISLTLLILMQVLNTAILSGMYIDEMGEKKPDPDHVTRKHFSFSLNLGVLLVLATLAGSIFIKGQTLQLFLITSTSQILSLLTTHFVARRFIREWK